MSRPSQQNSTCFRLERPCCPWQHQRSMIPAETPQPCRPAQRRGFGSRIWLTKQPKSKADISVEHFFSGPPRALGPHTRHVGFALTLSLSSMRSAARFLEIFLPFPSPSVTKSPTVQRVTKVRMCGGPDSRTTWWRKKGNICVCVWCVCEGGSRAGNFKTVFRLVSTTELPSVQHIVVLVTQSSSCPRVTTHPAFPANRHRAEDKSAWLVPCIARASSGQQRSMTGHVVQLSFAVSAFSFPVA